jgi:hypothetical protein
MVRRKRAKNKARPRIRKGHVVAFIVGAILL